MLSSEDLSRFVYGCGGLFWIRLKLRISRKIKEKSHNVFFVLTILLYGKAKAIIYSLIMPFKNRKLMQNTTLLASNIHCNQSPCEIYITPIGCSVIK